MDKSPCSGAALLLTDELSALSQTPASHTSWAKQQNAETLAVTQPVAKVPLVGENCEESRQLLQWEAISNARRWQSISPGNTAGKRRKKKKQKRRGMKAREIGKQLEMGTKGGTQCSESPSKHAVCCLDGDKRCTPRQQPQLDAALEPAPSSKVLRGSPANTSSPMSPGKAEAREGCCATEQTRKEAWLAKTDNFSFSLAVQLGSPLV